MNRLVATIYFVRSAWSAGALIPTIWHGSSSLSHRTSTVVANHKPFQPHGSAPSSTGVLSLSQSLSLSLSTASNTESAGTESPSPVAVAAAATRKDGCCCCIDEQGVRRLLSGAEFERMDALVRERSRARSEGNYTLADELKDEITGFAAGLVGRDGGGEGGGGFELFLRDIPRKSGGGSRWTLVPAARPLDEEFLSGTRILQLAHTAMGLAVEDNHHQQSQQRTTEQSSQQQRTTEQTRRNRRKKSLESLVEQARGRLEILLEETRTMEANTATLDADIEISTKQTMVRNELGGRTAADAALWFALAGCRDTALFHGLADIASWELNRFGQRPSCRSKNIYQILERFAAAGLKRHEKLEQIALECLLEKEKEEQQQKEQQQKEQRGERGAAGVESDGDGDDKTPSSLLLLNLHSDRSLLLIWKFASKQKKQQAFLRTAKKNWEQYREAEMGNEIPTETVADSIIHVEGTATHQNERGAESPYNWGDMFEDASRPLVVDVGCGMGVSLLGLASTTTTDRGASEQESARLLLGQNMKWSDCNFVGVDLGALGIEYSRGVAHRWNAEGNLQFVIDAAEDFCQHLQSYPGEIRCCMIQFPTPFRLQNKDGGNSQLPASKLEGFMVTENLLQTIHSSLDPKHGKLLLQSNCEDVAVWMRDLACRTVGFTALDDDDDREEPPHQGSIPQRIPQRTQDWIAMGGERAEGRGWFRRNILHRRGATETEATCAINGTPIHRCLLRVDQ
mmetsp:Transcript_25193/g.59409  ORF Transcript_25193/g.59409 Transcript_25193/m.59409 type:complete len:740 (-) Transcript_25193:73-2292(-)